MIWVIILMVVLSITCWFLISPLIMEIDTRIPSAVLRWVSIGNVSISYEEEWKLKMRIFFFSKTLRITEIKKNPKKIKTARAKKKKKRKIKMFRMLKKLVRVIKTFRVTEWRLAIDMGNNIYNAQLYPLNYLPYTFEHIYINFRDENYLVLKIRSRPWKVLSAFLR